MYPENFVNRILTDMGIHDVWVPDNNHLKAYEVVFAELTDQERNYVEAYYRDGNSLRTVGKMYGMTAEGVRRVLSNARKKLRHPTRLRWIIEGEEARIKYLEAWNRRHEMKESVTPTENDGITWLRLSKRSYNALWRWFGSREPSIKEVKALGFYDLTKIRGIGGISAMEVVKAVDRFYGR